MSLSTYKLICVWTLSYAWIILLFIIIYMHWKSGGWKYMGFGGHLFIHHVVLHWMVSKFGPLNKWANDLWDPWFFIH